MGWVKTLPSGRVQAIYRDPNGRQRSRTFRIKRDAWEWIGNAETAMRAGTYLDPNGPKRTFKDWSTEWVAAQATTPETRAQAASLLKCHILPAFGDKRLGSITRIAVQGWVTKLPLAPRSARSAYRVLAAIMNAAVDEGLIPSSPCRRITLPAVGQGEHVYLTAAEVHALAARLPERYQALALTAAYTGMRWEEVAGLPVSALDLLRGQLEVRQVLTRSGLRSYPKTRSSQRMLSIDEETTSSLAAHLARYPSRGLVFTNDAGGELDYQNFRKRVWVPAVAAFLAACKEPPGTPTFHDLRHTHAAWLIAAGVPSAAIAKRLGHSSIRVTIDVYGGLMPSVEDDLVRGLAETRRQAVADGLPMAAPASEALATVHAL